MTEGTGQDCVQALRTVMPALKMAESGDHQRQFQAAVDVIQNLPKNGSYRPSYEVMLRFYGFYKQAVVGPCTVSRPGFWDPVGRYKWDAWNRLGDMSNETAMAAYVDEMKKVAQEVVVYLQVIDTMPMDGKTASFFHYFEPLYKVIHDMPRPPESLLSVRAGQFACVFKYAVHQHKSLLAILKHNTTKDINDNDHTSNSVESEEGISPPDAPATTQDPVEELSPAVAPEQGLAEERAPSSHLPEPEPVSSDGLVLTSDSESEIYCDTVEQLDSGKSVSMPDGLDNRLAHCEPEGNQGHHVASVSQVTEVGSGQGGEGGGGGRGPPSRRRDSGRDAARHPAREPIGGGPERDAQHGGRLPLGVGGGGEDGSAGSDRLQEVQVQQQIMLALRRLREDMQSVMERLEVVEGLAAANAQSSDWRTRTPLPANEIEVNKSDWWWPFDVSGHTLLLLLLWPFFAQGLVFLLQRRKRKPHLPT
ncbi:acyl-CoA-binding domain-containing protein 4 isoform X1 [Alosa sapidissima]|uniref:acyl-CoA-binding domain-containing protein 4 isoform X1 n=2 Tax=Alosa sapidissima TaxID=34773 RepID=UPI001C08BCDC|nr:acyl-CoA-binding domain-containing protein 4 isoform X1 [Alosa sapidissima]